MVAYHLVINIGDLFDGKYRVINKIGSGSYGDVYKVTDSEGGTFALKLLRLWEIMGDLHEGLIKRFEQEYKVMRISSEYLVHSLDFGVVQGNPYILMEYCPQGDLSKFIGKDLKVVEFPKSIRCLRGAWLDSFDGEDCTYVFKSKQPPKIVEPSKNVSSVPIGSKIFVPEQSLKEYKKWFKINGGEMSRIEKIS